MLAVMTPVDLIVLTTLNSNAFEMMGYLFSVCLGATIQNVCSIKILLVAGEREPE